MRCINRSMKSCCERSEEYRWLHSETRSPSDDVLPSHFELSWIFIKIIRAVLFRKSLLPLYNQNMKVEVDAAGGFSTCLISSMVHNSLNTSYTISFVFHEYVVFSDQCYLE